MKCIIALTTLCLTCLILSGCSDTGAAKTSTKPNQRSPGSDSSTSFFPGDPFREPPRHTGVEPRDDRIATDNSSPQPNAPVPEPGTLFLVGTGLLGLAYLERRRNEAARR